MKTVMLGGKKEKEEKKSYDKNQFFQKNSTLLSKMCTWQVSIGVKQKILTPIQKRSLKNFLAHNDEKGSIFWFLKKNLECNL